MNRSILVSALLFMATAALGAQEANQPGPYQGTSTPSPDDSIVTTSTPHAKPPAGRRIAPQATPSQAQSRSASADPVVNDDSYGGMPAAERNFSEPKQPTLTQRAYSIDPDAGIVQVQPSPAQPSQAQHSQLQPSAPASSQPALTQRTYTTDPDGDIVHPRPLRPGELPEGTAIRVRLLDRLSTASSERGERFRSRVASDVLQGGKVLIPAGAEIDGRVAEVSSGHPGGHGSMHLRPDTVILADGTRYQLNAEITGTPGSKTKVGSEGVILPGSRLKRDTIEYGGAVGTGAVAGAIVGGPVGAAAGSLIGAGVITTHLLISHPQATLEPGTAMIFNLTEPLQMSPAASSGN